MRIFAICLAMTVGLAADTAQAASYAYVFDQTGYTVPLGQTVDVLVCLQETDGTVFHDNGLIGSGVKIYFNDPPLPSSPARVLTTAAVANISGFEQVWSKTAVPSSGYAGLSLGTFGYVYGTQSGANVYRMPLGRFTFTADGVPGEVTHIRATDFAPGLDDTVYYRNNDPLDPVSLDGVIQDATATITVTTPEPGSIVLLGLAVLSLLGTAGTCGPTERTNGRESLLGRRRMGTGTLAGGAKRLW
jgi:hypothetical protein